MKSPAPRAIIFFCMLLAAPAVYPNAAAGQPARELPGPNDRRERVVLTSENVDRYRDLLLEPVAEWVRSGAFVARLISELDFNWRGSEEWERATEANRGFYRVTEDGSLQADSEQVRGAGIPFPDLSRAFERDPDAAERRAAALLWNAVYAEAAAREIVYNIDIAWIGGQSLTRRSGGRLYRRWNLSMQGGKPEAEAGGGESSQPEHAAGSEAGKEASMPKPIFSGAGDLLVEELLQLQSPPVVFGYSQLLRRMRGSARDETWMYSPVIGKSRKIPPVHRGDMLLDGMLSLNDFFVWSGKPQSVRARVVAEKRLLVPFPALTPFLLEQGGEHRELAARGYHSLFDEGVATVRWNFETRQFPTFASWLPTTIFLVPRDAWLLEVEPRNPFYRTGRSILAIDRESGLPVYKLVYSHRGELERVVMAGWGLAQTKDSAVSAPFAGFLLGVDAAGRTATAVTTRQAVLLRGSDSPLAAELRRLLDIEEHVANQAAPKTADGPVSEPPSPEL